MILNPPTSQQHQSAGVTWSKSSSSLTASSRGIVMNYRVTHEEAASNKEF